MIPHDDLDEDHSKKEKVIICASQQYVVEVCFQMWDQRSFYVISYIMIIRISPFDKDIIKELKNSWVKVDV